MTKRQNRPRPEKPRQALAAARLATLQHGGDRSGKTPLPAVTSTEAGALHGVSRRTVEHAKVILRLGTPEVVARVERGELGIAPTAMLLLRLHRQRQRSTEALL